LEVSHQNFGENLAIIYQQYGVSSDKLSVFYIIRERTLSSAMNTS